MSITDGTKRRQSTYQPVNRQTSQLGAPQDERVHVGNDVWLQQGLQMFTNNTGNAVQELIEHDARIDLAKGKQLQTAILTEAEEFNGEAYEDYHKDERIRLKREVMRKHLGERQKSFRPDIEDMLINDLESTFETDEIKIAQRIKERTDKNHIRNGLAHQLNANGFYGLNNEVNSIARHSGRSLDLIYDEAHLALKKSKNPQAWTEALADEHYPERLKADLRILMPQLKGMSEWDKEKLKLKAMDDGKSIMQSYIGEHGVMPDKGTFLNTVLGTELLSNPANDEAVSESISAVTQGYNDAVSRRTRLLGYLADPSSMSWDSYKWVLENNNDPSHWGLRLSSFDSEELLRKSSAQPDAQYFNSNFNRLSAFTEQGVETDVGDAQRFFTTLKAREWAISDIVEGERGVLFEHLYDEYREDILSSDPKVAKRAILSLQADAKRFRENNNGLFPPISDKDAEKALNSLKDDDAFLGIFWNSNPDVDALSAYHVRSNFLQYLRTRTRINGNYDRASVRQMAMNWKAKRYHNFNGKMYPKSIFPTNDIEKIKSLLPLVDEGINTVKKELITLEINRDLGIKAENIRHSFDKDGISFWSTTGAPLLVDGKQGQRGGLVSIPYSAINKNLQAELTTLTGEQQVELEEHEQREERTKQSILEKATSKAYEEASKPTKTRKNRRLRRGKRDEPQSASIQ